MFLASIYCRYGDPLEPYLGYMDAVLLVSSSFPTILALDANASSRLWFSKTTGLGSRGLNLIRGETLSEYLLSKDLSVLNEPSDLYTFDGPVGASDIDVTVANGAAINTFDSRWRVCDNWGVSDHSLIEIMLSYQQRTRETVGVTRWRTRDANWDQYSFAIREALSSVPLEDFRALTIDDQVEKIERAAFAVNDAVLGRVHRAEPRRVKWWTRELDTMRRHVRHLRKHFQRGRRANVEDLALRKQEYFRSLKTYKNKIVVVKEDQWRSFVQDNRDDPWGKVYRICRGRKSNIDISSLRVGNTVLSSWRDCTDALLGVFFPAAEPIGYIPPPRDINDPPNLVRSEIGDSFSRVKSRRSPGIDGLTGEMCKSIWKAIPEYLEAIYGRCISEGYFPKAWKIARIVVLLKSPDKVRSDPRSYRGISLLPVLGKVLERIMVRRLEECYTEGISRHQYGFREGKSVEDAWAYVKASVQQSSSKYVLGLFVDFKGAFDNLLWDNVLQRLSSIGCRELGIWRSYFESRKACSVGASETVWKDVARGCPQGSICGPFIWNLIMDSLLRRLEPTFKLCAYADDLLILVEGRTRAELETMGAQAIRIACEWGAQVGVEVAIDKTVTMLLKGILSQQRHPLIRIGTGSIRYVTKVRYLGVVVGERMSFYPHLMHVRAKLTAIVGKVRRILRSDWGLGRRAVRTIYGGLFVACAAYGSSVWYEMVMSSSGRSSALTCQRIALLACVPVCRTVSTDALQVLVGAPPLDLEVILRGITFKVKRGLPLGPHDWLSNSELESGVIRCKALLRERLIDRWQTRWTNNDRGRVTFSFIPNVTFVQEHQDFGFGLSLGFILTGHGSLNAFLHKIGQTDTEDCRCGMGPEDWRHVLTTCPRYADIRNLDSMGITHTQGVWDFSRALMTDRTLRGLGEFANSAFRSRRRDLSGGIPPNV